VNELTRAKVESPVARVLREGAIVGLANHTVLIARVTRSEGTPMMRLRPVSSATLLPHRGTRKTGAEQGTFVVPQKT